jgi:hypothetical protein
VRDCRSLAAALGLSLLLHAALLLWSARQPESRVRDFASLAGHVLLSTVTNEYVAPTGRFGEQSGSVEAVDLTDPHFSCHVKLLRL